jgi:hypothetical protein
MPPTVMITYMAHGLLLLLLLFSIVFDRLWCWWNALLASIVRAGFIEGSWRDHSSGHFEALVMICIKVKGSNKVKKKKKYLYRTKRLYNHPRRSLKTCFFNLLPRKKHRDQTFMQTIPHATPFGVSPLVDTVSSLPQLLLLSGLRIQAPLFCVTLVYRASFFLVGWFQLLINEWWPRTNIVESASSCRLFNKRFLLYRLFLTRLQLRWMLGLSSSKSMYAWTFLWARCGVWNGLPFLRH